MLANAQEVVTNFLQVSRASNRVSLSETIMRNWMEYEVKNVANIDSKTGELSLIRDLAKEKGLKQICAQPWVGTLIRSFGLKIYTVG